MSDIEICQGCDAADEDICDLEPHLCGRGTDKQKSENKNQMPT